ncbi:MAG: zinc-binding dehydrogenase [Desulfobacteraceae bacterium]
MTTKYQRYRSAEMHVPAQTWAWNLYGAGMENIGRNNRPETLSVPEPDENQMLVRIDSVALCFSDVKVINMGGRHPKLYNRDLASEPTRLGHETSLTVVKVGRNLQDRYRPGQRLAVQPDIYQNGKSTAYGYTIPGGLIQYHLIGPEMLDTDEGACLLPIEGDLGLGYAESSLLEPWGCVMAAYTQRRRLEPKKDGMMWIVGRPGDQREYDFSSGLDAPGTIVLTDVPQAIKKLVSKTTAQILIRDGLQVDAYAGMVNELTDDKGFDDIVVLDPASSDAVGTIAQHIARRGTLNLVGETPLDGMVPADVGRLHYDYIAFLGTQGPDVAAAYGSVRNRCELVPQGVAVFVGAGGPMGQMHVQRAIELPDGPRKIIATEVNARRLAALEQRVAPIAAKNNRELIYLNPRLNPRQDDGDLYDHVMQITQGRGADDVVVCVPVAEVMAQAATLMNPNGMLVFFAGVPNGTMAPLNLSAVYMDNAQYTGTSGLTINDQALVMQRAAEGQLSTSRSVGAIGGMLAAKEGIQAMIEGRYPGKIVIFPQIHDLPLMGLDELKDKIPEVSAKLEAGDAWTTAAEEVLIETYWKG